MECYPKVKDVLSTFLAKPKLIFTNIPKEGRKVLWDLQKDDSHTVLTAEKELAPVIMDKDLYIDKFMAVLDDENDYKEYRVQTKSKVVKQLLDHGPENSIGYRFKDDHAKRHPAGGNGLPVRFYCLFRIHKANIPSRPIVSTCGTSVYKFAKFLTQIFQQYCGKQFTLCQR